MSKTYQGIFFEARKPGSVIYCLGSIHCAPKKPKFHKDILKIFDKCDILTVENSIAFNKESSEEEVNTISDLFLNRTIPLSKDELDFRVKLLNESYKFKFISRARKELIVNNLCDFAYASLISQMKFEKLGLKFKNGVDYQICELAKKQNKEIFSLEDLSTDYNNIFTSDTSVNFSEMPDDEIMTKKDLSYLKDMYYHLRDGNYKKIRELEKGFADTSLIKKEELFDNRNVKMVEKLIELSKSYKKIFCCTGSGHYLGNNSMLDCLKANGYTIYKFNLD